MEPPKLRHAVLHQVGTSWLEAGTPHASRPPLVLLHGGAWGESAATAWSAVLPALAAHRRVIAPDWLGFGRSDKLVDFTDRAGRMLDHLAALLGHLGLAAGEIDVVGLSMGGSHLLRDLTADRPRLSVRRAVLVSAGGPPIAGEARERLMDFDGTARSMRAQIRLAFADAAWAEDEAFVHARLDTALAPGAYEAFASLALRSPGAAPPPLGDPVPYERIAVPVLVTGGTEDRLKPPGWAKDMLSRLPDGRLRLYEGCGHCPHLEAADAWSASVLDFLDEGAVP